MKTHLTATLIALSLITSTALTTAAHAASASGNASAVVESTPIVVSEMQPLYFGKFIPGSADGVVYTDGIAGGGGLTLNEQGNNGKFLVEGDAGRQVTASLPNSTITLTSGTDSMTAELSLASETQTLDNTGAGQFSVLGRLTVAARQKSGTYNGTYSLDVNY